MKVSKILGAKAERAAEEYLHKQGFITLATNYRCKYGEIDLIMADNNSLVFVEVKQRKEDDYGNSLESVTRAKQNKIIKTAKYYLLEKNLFDKIICRFDVIAINGELDNSEILWIKDAFWVKY